MLSLKHTARVCGAAIALAACTGTIGDSDGDGANGNGNAQQPLCEAPQPGENPMRRLTSYEYANTVRVLLGDTIDPGTDFPETVIDEGFRGDANANIVSSSGADAIMRAAEHVAAQANVPSLVGCDPSDAACLDGFIDSFGSKAYRRPIFDDEKVILQNVFDGAVASGFTSDEAISMVVEVVLMSPQFLYRPEMANADAVAAGEAALVDSWEIASRISYLFWDTTPDDALYAAAEDGTLNDPAVLEAQARRMLADPRAREPVAKLFEDWLEIHRLNSAVKDTAVFPQWTPELHASMEAELGQFVSHVIFDDDGTLETLLTTTTSVVNGPLASVYGVSGPSGVSDWQAVTLDETQRAGLLTTAAFLAAQANAASTNPVQRGAFVRSKLLCQVLLPPDDLVIEQLNPDPNLPKREKLAEHRDNPACSTCHRLMDPIGFGLENYDAIGQWRITEGNNIPVDATGELEQAGSVSGPFEGAIELADKLSQSELVEECMALQSFRFASGRENRKEDACSLDQLNTAFAESGGNLVELLVALTKTDAFRYRMIEELEDSQ